TLGTQMVTATDRSLLPVEGTTNVIVSAAANDLLGVSLPLTVVAGKPFTFTVTAYDTFHNVDAGYTGTVHFTTTDGNGPAGLPIDYIFTSADHGSHRCSATFITGRQIGGRTQTQTLTATDSVNGAIGG